MLQSRLLRFSIGSALIYAVHSQFDLKEVLISHMDREVRFLEAKFSTIQSSLPDQSSSTSASPSTSRPQSS